MKYLENKVHILPYNFNILLRDNSKSLIDDIRVMNPFPVLDVNIGP
jgi:hypothetical protein